MSKDVPLSLRQWVYSLSTDELITAMTFSFQNDAACENGGPLESHEFQLLKEMIHLQVPNAMPIFGRAVPLIPAASHGISDGRDELYSSYKARFQRPRLFQFIPKVDFYSCYDHDTMSNNTKEKQKRDSKKRQRRENEFDVMARKFISPWGDCWTIGCTTTQQRADEDILKGTCIDYGSYTDKKHRSNPVLGFFHPASTSTTSLDILHMLHVVSRGTFLANTIPLGSSQSIPFCAPWFHPTQQWFSLSKFLASRYEVSLRDSYTKWLSTLHSQEMTLKPTLRQDTDRRFQVRYKDLDPQLFLKAVQVAFLATWKEDEKILDQGYIRDMTLFQLLHEIFIPSNGTGSSLSIASIPIVLYNTFLDSFRLRLHTHVQEQLAQIAERNLILSLEEKPIHISWKNRKKKKKHGRKKSVILNQHPPCSVSEMDKAFDKSLNLPSEPMTMEKSRNTILVLSLLDDILHSVLDQVDNRVTVSDARAGDEIASCDDLHSHFSVDSVHWSPTGSAAFTSTEVSEVIQSYPTESEPCTMPSASAVQDIVNGSMDGGMDSTPSKSTVQTKVTDIVEDPTGIVWKEPPKETLLTSPQGVISSPIHEADAVNPEPSPTRPCLSLLDFMLRQQGLYHYEPSIAIVNAVKANDNGDFYVIEDVGLVSDLWWNLRPYQSRDRSIFADFFQDDQDLEDFVASSTAASLASSVPEDEAETSPEMIDDTLIMETDFNSNVEQSAVSPVDKDLSIGVGMTIIEESDDERRLNRDTPVEHYPEGSKQSNIIIPPRQTHSSEFDGVPNQSWGANDECGSNHSPLGNVLVNTSESPKTLTTCIPAPQANPILISLADLDKLKKKRQTISEVSWGRFSDKSLSSSDLLDIASLPKSTVALKLPLSASKEDFRVQSRDHMFPALKKRGGNLLNSLNGPRARSVSSHDALDMNRSTRSFDHKKVLHSHRTNTHSVTTNEVIIDAGNIHLDFCAQSEAAMNVLEESSHLNVIPKHVGHDEEITAFRDENSTISSAPSPIPGELTSLRDERNGYRDLCLTLAAENAKIKNVLALALQSLQNNSNSNRDIPDCIRPFHDSLISKGDGRVEALRDVGAPHEIYLSEDGTAIQETSTVYGGTDTVSTEHLTWSGTHVTFQHMTLKDPMGHVHLNGLETRLTIDIKYFLKNVDAQLKRLSSQRGIATTRLKRLVALVWPRAQVKIYGSHLSNLSLPTSDMDFVILLPAVHKNAPVDAAGVLEGRNSTNEPHQKVLARKLRHESWIEPRSLRVIERTTVPVIKVQTKDSHTRQIQLDITFDSPEHFGLKAAELVNTLMNDLPMIRPLVLVLKQFLLDRGLLTAYTGGLSSYCLFLMVTRYCQEQPHSTWSDSGALLIGFLDFYGNHFDPRSTGISVGQRRYFSRPRYTSDQGAQQNCHFLPQVYTRSRSINNAVVGFDDMNAFYPSPLMLPTGTAQYSRPFTFDPLYVEDPLHPSNNVGRNAFRIFQVKRAFSDAHQALITSLEWDLSVSSSDQESLLRCLLNNDGALSSMYLSTRMVPRRPTNYRPYMLLTKSCRLKPPVYVLDLCLHFS